MVQSEKEGTVTTNIYYTTRCSRAQNGNLMHVSMGAKSNENFGREENYDHWRRKRRRSSEKCVQRVCKAKGANLSPIARP